MWSHVFWNTVYFWLGKTTARHTGILLPILSLAISPYSACHSALGSRISALCCQVYQSALALLGHVLIYETGPTEPAVDAFLDVIRSKLETSTTAKTRGNALWALVHAAANQSASEDRLLVFVDRLIAIFKQTDDEPMCIINAGMTNSRIGSHRTDFIDGIGQQRI